MGLGIFFADTLIFHCVVLFQSVIFFITFFPIFLCISEFFFRYSFLKYDIRNFFLC